MDIVVFGFGNELNCCSESVVSVIEFVLFFKSVKGERMDHFL